MNKVQQVEKILVSRFAYQGDVKTEICNMVAQEIRQLFEPKGERPPVLSGKEIDKYYHLHLGVNKATRAQRDDTYQKMLDAFEPIIQQAKREIFEEIEGESEVIDWRDDLGKMRELKEETYQSIKSKYLKG